MESNADMLKSQARRLRSLPRLDFFFEVDGRRFSLKSYAGIVTAAIRTSTYGNVFTVDLTAEQVADLRRQLDLFLSQPQRDMHCSKLSNWAHP